MLDRPATREGWLARAAALTIEGRAFIDGAYVDALDGATFARISPIDGKAFATRIVGLDVAKKKVDACIHSLGLRRSAPSTPEGEAELIAWLRSNGVRRA